MPRLVYEGRTNVYWATTIANKNAPTIAEITAAIELTDYVTKDGVSVNVATNTADSATIAEIYDAKVVGSYGTDPQLTMFRDDLNDTAWELCVYGTNGYLIIDRFNTAGTLPSAGDKVEVHPTQMHVPAMQNSATNAQQRFIEQFAGTAAPVWDAVVAAS